MFRIRLLKGEWYCDNQRSREEIKRYFEKRGVVFLDNDREVFLPRNYGINIGSDDINNNILFRRGRGVYSVQCTIIIYSNQDIQMRTYSRDDTVVCRGGAYISQRFSDNPVQIREGDILQIRENKIKILEAKVHWQR